MNKTYTKFISMILAIPKLEINLLSELTYRVYVSSPSYNVKEERRKVSIILDIEKPKK